MDAKQLRGPVIESICLEGPTSHMGNALPFADIKLASLKHFLGTLAICDVLDGTEHLAGLPRSIFLQVALTMHGAQFAIGTDDSVFYVRAQSSANGLLRHSEHKFQI